MIRAMVASPSAIAQVGAITVALAMGAASGMDPAVLSEILKASSGRNCAWRAEPSLLTGLEFDSLTHPRTLDLTYAPHAPLSNIDSTHAPLRH